jgi:uncharacterized membrane protein
MPKSPPPAAGPAAPRPKRRARVLVSPRYAVGRLIIAAAFAATAFALLAPTQKPWFVRAVVGWDVGALTLITLAWTVILRATSGETRKRAGTDDPGRHVVFGIALMSSVFSLFAAGFVLKHIKSFAGAEQATWTLLTLAAIALSWVLTHTAYTLRYAHLYYRGGGARGLKFPGDEEPADIDFAYFSFTVGMCFQVSDVLVTTTDCRRAVLLHSVLSFVYNTMILALALNLVFGLVG